MVAGSSKDFGITVSRSSLKYTVPKFRGADSQRQVISYDNNQISMSIYSGARGCRIRDSLQMPTVIGRGTPALSVSKIELRSLI
jgi:hypothetical protein